MAALEYWSIGVGWFGAFLCILAWFAGATRGSRNDNDSPETHE